MHEARAERQGSSRHRLGGGERLAHLGRLDAAVHVAMREVRDHERGIVPSDRLVEAERIGRAALPSLSTDHRDPARQQPRKVPLELAAPAVLDAAAPARTGGVAPEAAHLALGHAASERHDAKRLAVVDTAAKRSLHSRLHSPPRVDASRGGLDAEPCQVSTQLIAPRPEVTTARPRQRRRVERRRGQVAPDGARAGVDTQRLLEQQVGTVGSSMPLGPMGRRACEDVARVPQQLRGQWIVATSSRPGHIRRDSPAFVRHHLCQIVSSWF